MFLDSILILEEIASTTVPNKAINKFLINFEYFAFLISSITVYLPFFLIKSTYLLVQQKHPLNHYLPLLYQVFQHYFLLKNLVYLQICSNSSRK